MTAIHDVADFAEANASIWSSLTRIWKAFEASRKCRRLRSQLCSLSDHELADMGTSRGEIEYVVLNSLREHMAPPLR